MQKNRAHAQNHKHTFENYTEGGGVGQGWVAVGTFRGTPKPVAFSQRCHLMRDFPCICCGRVQFFSYLFFLVRTEV